MSAKTDQPLRGEESHVKITTFCHPTSRYPSCYVVLCYVSEMSILSKSSSTSSCNYESRVIGGVVSIPLSVNIEFEDRGSAFESEVVSRIKLEEDVSFRTADTLCKTTDDDVLAKCSTVLSTKLVDMVSRIKPSYKSASKTRKAQRDGLDAAQ